jgi:hypothetical protein
VELRQVTDLGSALRNQLARLAPADVPLPEAPAMWAAYDSIERCAAAAKTLLAERVEQSRVWAKEGDRSAAEHLARKSGSSVGAVRAGLETSKKLRLLPATEAAVRRGELSQAQAETITDAAAVNPGAEQSLLEAAGAGTLGVTYARRPAGRRQPPIPTPMPPIAASTGSAACVVGPTPRVAGTSRAAARPTPVP